MNRHFSEKAQADLRSAIDDAGGNEVFFLGRVDEALLVVEVEPLARGNREAVPAIMAATSFGDVVIHNHPGGNTDPSHADIEIASILGNQGVGFYIIDNGASRCCQVVKPFRRTTLERLSYSEIDRWYAADGTLARNLPEYEHRQEQSRMAFAVAESFNDDRVALIEAGTGTGKSLAYLLPALLWCIRNKERVVVSTNTINLQEQLIRKDIPFLQKHGGIEFRAVLVKGRANYLCKRKLEGLESEPALFKDEQTKELEAIIEWSRNTSDGCRSDLPFIPRDELWEELCCEADQCSRVKCRWYGACFFYTARREAAGADLLVVNHALLMADLAVRKESGYGSTAILPPFQRVIIDEGHHLEDVATGYLSSQASRQGLLRITSKLRNPRKPQRGLLPQLSALLSREVPESMDDLYMEAAGILEGKLIPGSGLLSDTFGRKMDLLSTLLLQYLKKDEDRPGEQKLRVTPVLFATRFWEEVEQTVRELARESAEYAAALKAFLKICGRLPENVQEKLGSVLVDLKGIEGRLESARQSLLFFISREEEFCHWFEMRKTGRGTFIKLCSSPLEVAPSIKGVLLDRFKTVVITSATLAVGESFDYLSGRVGVNLLPNERVTRLLLASPFDYARQALVGIPAELPEPGGAGFEAALCDVLLKSLHRSQGRAFVLFTSYDLLGRVFNRLHDAMERLGLTPLRQGQMNRHLLLSRFRKERNPVLFGTDSFWEGVDVQGKALEMVVIARLPFRVPTEPVLEARAEHIASRGEDPFMEYSVPQAVIKFKQGFGRLIRSRNDRGVVLILDTRVINKNYGRRFLRSLPEVPVVSGSSAEVLDRIGGFFSSCRP